MLFRVSARRGAVYRFIHSLRRKLSILDLFEQLRDDFIRERYHDPLRPLLSSRQLVVDELRQVALQRRLGRRQELLAAPGVERVERHSAGLRVRQLVLR